METPDELKSNAEVAQLKAEISSTQDELQQTVAEIQDRLSPSHLKEQATNTVREATKHATSTVREATIGRVQHMVGNGTNPIPYALIAVGAAWLFANRRSQNQWRSGGSDWNRGASQYGSTEYYSTDAEFASPYANESGYSGYSSESGSGTGVMGAVGARTGEMTEQARQRANEARERARRVAWQARNRWDSMLNNNPMGLGVAALAAGALVGAALPVSNVENRYMGEARDTVVDSAKSMAQNAADKVTDTAKSVVGGATQGAGAGAGSGAGAGGGGTATGGTGATGGIGGTSNRGL